MRYQALLVSTVLSAALVVLLPQYLTTPRVSRTVLRFLIVDLVLFSIWQVFVYPLLFSPLRDLPGPAVSLARLPSPPRSNGAPVLTRL
jgi:hypothetical protein